MFDHMNTTKNLSKAEMEQQKRMKKRKLNEISKTEQTEVMIGAKVESKTGPTNLTKKQTDIKECPFNPFGDESCDMCGS